jgi:hypothetical protein
MTGQAICCAVVQLPWPAKLTEKPPAFANSTQQKRFNVNLRIPLTQ